MGTEILLPPGGLARQSTRLFSRRSFNPNFSHKLLRKAPSQAARWRRGAGLPRLEKPQKLRKQLVIGQVMILKRVEAVDRTAARKEERVGAARNWPRLGPEKIRVIPGASENVYAGPAFSASPSPKSLPLPSFSRGDTADRAFKRSATVVIRRLLGLD